MVADILKLNKAEKDGTPLPPAIHVVLCKSLGFPGHEFLVTVKDGGIFSLCRSVVKTEVVLGRWVGAARLLRFVLHN